MLLIILAVGPNQFGFQNHNLLYTLYTLITEKTLTLKQPADTHRQLYYSGISKTASIVPGSKLHKQSPRALELICELYHELWLTLLMIFSSVELFAAVVFNYFYINVECVTGLCLLVIRLWRTLGIYLKLQSC